MADLADIANEWVERQVDNVLSSHQLPQLYAVNDECEECGEEIPAARRKAAPWATTCIECQQILEEKRRHQR